jgi:uncharacterized protein (DUF1499 family)
MNVIKWIFIAAILLVVGALATLSFLTRETRINPDSEPRLKPCPGTPNCVSSLAAQGPFRIEPLALIDHDPDTSWQKLVTVIQQQGGELVRQDSHYAHAVFTSSLFRFKDDLEVVLEQDRIDLRSASRAGKSDLGKNRQRVELIRQAYQS